ncbi:hypothetical protein BHM03_00040891 [Ensete ventricosum]|nr:hypothetical protein BHM03_00040891 [Ensete ventricosum]
MAVPSNRVRFGVSRPDTTGGFPREPLESMAMAPNQVRFGVSGASTSGGFPREPLESMATEEDLHKGLVGMGVPDMTHPMLKSIPDLLFRK